MIVSPAIRKILNLALAGLIAAALIVGLMRWLDYRETPAIREFAMARLRGEVPPATLDGTHRCMLTVLSNGDEKPTLTRCETPTIHQGVVDEFEVDLRYGAFKVRQTDLEVKDIFDVPLTRTYIAQDWVGRDRVQEFGKNTNHPYDVAPLGTRNPYTEMQLTLEDGDFLYFKRDVIECAKKGIDELTQRWLKTELKPGKATASVILPADRLDLIPDSLTPRIDVKSAEALCNVHRHCLDVIGIETLFCLETPSLTRIRYRERSEGDL